MEYETIKQLLHIAFDKPMLYVSIIAILYSVIFGAPMIHVLITAMRNDKGENSKTFYIVCLVLSTLAILWTLWIAFLTLMMLSFLGP